MLIPMVVWLGIHGAYENWLFQEDTTNLWLEFGSLLFLIFLDGLIFTLFAVPSHRSILLGEQAVSKFGLVIWGIRETRFVLLVGLVYFLAYFIFGLFGMLFGVFVFIVSTLVDNSENIEYFFPLFCLFFIPFGYILGRTSVIFPAAAVERSTTLRSVWEHSKGNEWRLATIVGIPVFLGLSFPWLVFLLIGEEAHPFLVSGISGVVYFSTATVEIVAVSLAFKELFRWNPLSEDQAH